MINFRSNELKQYHSILYAYFLYKLYNISPLLQTSSHGPNSAPDLNSTVSHNTEHETSMMGQEGLVTEYQLFSEKSGPAKIADQSDN